MASASKSSARAGYGPYGPVGPATSEPTSRCDLSRQTWDQVLREHRSHGLTVVRRLEHRGRRGFRPWVIVPMIALGLLEIGGSSDTG